eukprot:5520093-Amphidinium_carterae.1
MAIGVVTIAYFLGGATSSGYMANHADISNNYAGLTFSISNTVATIPGIAAGPFTAWSQRTIDSDRAISPPLCSWARLPFAHYCRVV